MFEPGFASIRRFMAWGIISGTKATRRKHGHVADFCQACRQVRSFVLWRNGCAAHLYYLSLNAGKLVDYDRVCAHCGAIAQVDLARYASILEREIPLPQLQEQSFPDLQQVESKRLELDARLLRAKDALTAEERGDRLLEPFKALELKVERHLKSRGVDWYFAAAVVVAIMLLIIGVQMIKWLTPEDSNARWIALVAVLAFIISVLAWQALLSRRRFVRTKVLPYIWPAIEPLEPAADELDHLILHLKLQKYAIGDSLSMDDFAKFLRRSVPVQSGVGRI